MKILENIPGNFRNKYKNIKNGLKCTYCEEKMTQNHCVTCSGRSRICQHLDMNQLDDLVIYFKLSLMKNQETMDLKCGSGNRLGCSNNVGYFLYLFCYCMLYWILYLS